MSTALISEQYPSLNDDGHPGPLANDRSAWPAITADGRFVAFLSEATNVRIPDAIPDQPDPFRAYSRDRDRDGNGIFDEPDGVLNFIASKSKGAGHNYPTVLEPPSITADGAEVAFATFDSSISEADPRVCPGLLVLPSCSDVTVRNVYLEQGELISVTSGPASEQEQGSGHSLTTAMTPDGRVIDRVAVTTVHMNRSRADWLDWYLSTTEPDGKAGGYAIQGLASVFVDRIEGSLTNVIGLPLEETREMLLAVDLVDAAAR